MNSLAWDEYKRQQELLPRSDILRRGWTLRLIEAHLGEPDKVTRNPAGKAGDKMYLFRLGRVEQAEQDPIVAAALAKALARRRAR